MVKKALIIEISFHHYEVAEEDAIRLLLIAQRCRALKRDNWNGPFQYDDDGGAFIKSAEIAEVEVPDNPSSQPSSGPHLAAARGLP